MRIIQKKNIIDLINIGVANEENYHKKITKINEKDGIG